VWVIQSLLDEYEVHVVDVRIVCWNPWVQLFVSVSMFDVESVVFVLLVDEDVAVADDDDDGDGDGDIE
jgi:hypothetical protein